MAAVCVFCGAKVGGDPRYVATAREFGASLARRAITLVFGGGHVGMMGSVADGALEAGGEVIGIIPQRLVERELGHRGIDRLELVPDMATRKLRMIELSAAFVALPGGLGTLDEIFEVLTLRQIGEHHKPMALLDLDGYFGPLLTALEGFARAGFIARHDIDHLIVEPTIERLLDRLAPYLTVAAGA